MRRIVRVVVLVALAVWAWRTLVTRRQPPQRVSVSYADGSSVVLEQGSAEFEQLAGIARGVLRS
jgi:hypothetical protein